MPPRRAQATQEPAPGAGLPAGGPSALVPGACRSRARPTSASYEVDVALEGTVLGTGEGRSRRDAETEAAAMALATLADAETEAGSAGHRRG